MLHPITYDKYAFARKAMDALLRGNIHAALDYLQRFLNEEAPPVPSHDDIISEARHIMRRSYNETVERAAKSIFDDYCRGMYAGSRESLQEDIDNTADGRVTYTSSAQECLLYSNNDSAGPEELGADSFDWKSGVPWSALAYWAFRADLLKELENLGIDVDRDPPEADERAVKCDQCGIVKAAVKDSTTCNECEEENGNEQCSACETWYSPEYLLDGVCEECREPKTQEGKDPRRDDRNTGVP